MAKSLKNVSVYPQSEEPPAIVLSCSPPEEPAENVLVPLYTSLSGEVASARACLASTRGAPGEPSCFCSVRGVAGDCVCCDVARVSPESFGGGDVPPETAPP